MKSVNNKWTLANLGSGRWAAYPPAAFGGLSQYFGSEKEAADYAQFRTEFDAQYRERKEREELDRAERHADALAGDTWGAY